MNRLKNAASFPFLQPFSGWYKSVFLWDFFHGVENEPLKKELEKNQKWLLPDLSTVPRNESLAFYSILPSVLFIIHSFNIMLIQSLHLYVNWVRRENET